MKRLAVSVVAVVFVCVGFQAANVAARSTRAAAQVPKLVGVWTVSRTCAGLVASARRAGVGKLAPQIVGDYFPGQSPQELAKKKHLCAGATPQRHSHFFDREGQFGSLDQYGQQVDDGHYRFVKGNTFKIGHSSFHYKVVGKTLNLVPMIPARLVRLANVHPFKPNDAGWMVAVAYAGHTWKRAPRNEWC
jgi:hypothetical protein